MLRELKKAFGIITEQYKENKNITITDNYYLLFSAYERLQNEKRAIKKNRHLLQFARRFTEQNNYTFRKSSYVEFMRSLPSTVELNMDVLSIMPSIILLYLIVSISKNNEIIPNAVEMIRTITKTDISELDAILFVAEPLLETIEMYDVMTTETKNIYRRALTEYAKRNKITIKKAEEKIRKEKKEITSVLFKKKKQSFFYPLVMLLSVALVIAYWRSIGALTLLLLIPIWLSVGEIVDIFCSKGTKNEKIKRVDPKKCTVLPNTLVVITSLINENDTLFENIELFYLANKTSPAYFGLLLDHPDSTNEIDEKSEELTAKAQRRINELNEKYGERFFLFLRKRVKNEDGVYYGWERKRGAVTELVRYIYNEPTTITHFVGNRASLGNVKYLLTLDSDSMLTLESVNEMLGAMMHPFYRPIVKGGRVESGYGIMQPKMSPTLESSSKTFFSSMMSVSGGTDIYESASYDRYMNTFGEGAFCGKGIIDIELFHNLVDLPEGFVLSHDLPEGAIMRTLSLCDVTLSDSTPKNMLSFATRNGRWCRGDIQNLWLWNKVGKIGKIMMLSNVARIISPILTVSVILLSLFLEPSRADLITFLSLLPCLLPFVVSVLVSPSYFVLLTKRRTFAKITKNAIKQLYVALYKILSLCYIASVNLISVIRSLYRMTISKKKRLEWITASEMDRSGKGGFWYFVQRMMISVSVGAILFVSQTSFLQTTLGLSWFLFPLVAYFQSFPMKNENDLEKNDDLFPMVEKMYRFFRENVNESTHHLPPDNVSYFPSLRVAMRTSPTNIALYLLSTVSAYDISLISKTELGERLENTLETLEKLDKWNGHLYNWYDLNDLAVLGGNYVSTVDSGNFITSIISVVEALKEYGFTVLAKRYEALTHADMTKLYNKDRELFYLGYDESIGKYGDICYDLYMSEARTTSYFACAMGYVPKKHWKTLSRTLLEKNGYIGMASWTGTAFEYFMPMILLPDIKNSFPSEALRFAYDRQRAQTRHSLYGISESGYYSFDHELNYQYKAFGVSDLGMKYYSECEYVFSPYSTFLMMYLDKKSAKNNLRLFEMYGGSGKYGCYEAIDMRDETPRVIKSYMSHHVGMSICSCVNMMIDNVHQKRFMRNKNMKCAHELLEERIPDVAFYKDPKKDHPKKYTTYDKKTETISSTVPEPTVTFLDGDGVSVIASSLGAVSMRIGELLVNDRSFTLPFSDKTVKTNVGSDAVMEISNDSISFITNKDCRSTEYSIKGNCIVITLMSNDNENTIEFDVVLEKENEFYSHPAFSRLFVTSEYDEKTNILYFVRKSRRTNELLYLAVARFDGLPFCFKTRRGGEIGETGGTLYPTLRATGLPHEKKTTFLITAAKTISEAEENIATARKMNKTNIKTPSALTREILKNILYRKIPIGTSRSKRDVLFEYGISGDHPLVFVAHPSPFLLREYLCAFSELTSIGTRIELVILAEDEDVYAKENTRTYKKIIKEQDLENFLSKKGGIFVLSRISDEKRHFFELFSSQNENAIRCVNDSTSVRTVADQPYGDVQRTNGGYFTECGYTVICDEIKDTKWSFILTGRSFGTILTHDSLGFSYYLNSAKGRLSYFSGDVYSEQQGERLIATHNGNRIDLIKSASTMYVSPDLVIYSGMLDAISYKVYVTVDGKYPIKFIRLVSSSPLFAEYSVIPKDNESITTKKGDVTSLMNDVSLMVGTTEKGSYIDNGIGVRASGNDLVFYLLGGKTIELCEKLREMIDRDLYLRSLKIKSSPLPPIKIKLGETMLDHFVNKFLPYQVYASRFMARSGYFQISGAFGYRDQLQDVMALCYSDTNLARTHIIRCSARQYEDGSVNHWFFPNAEGVKTKCSDDFIYLPLVVAHYISLTNDLSLLNVKTEYLTSSPLGNKSERFELPQKSGSRETVYEHCKRALQYSLKRGPHGLPLLGSCDWNDGFSHFGEKGVGESVLNAMQYVYAYEKFIPIMRMMNDSDAEFWESEAKKLRKAAESCFENDRFIRAYGDNGEKLGSADSDECKIDLTVQAFSVIANIGTREMQEKALNTMWNELFDEKMKVLRLFAPSFTKNDRRVGYIQGYIDGIRENGGQYTHAAVWGLISLVELGMIDRATILLRSLCPSWRQSVGGAITEAYKSEPYAMCGDVYFSQKFKGRGGWSHYTGSAGWYYRAILETMMGIKLENNFKTLTVIPKIEYCAELDYHGKVKIIAKNGKDQVLLDGKVASFPLALDGESHIVEVFTEKIHGIDR